jgi:hypothetical protein
MRNMFNNKDNIRPPDEVISEQLLEDDRDEFQQQMDEAMYLSMQETNRQRDIHREYEEQILKNYHVETNRRTEIFKDFLFNINKVGKFDKEVRDMYDILEPIIESYCGQYIETCELDEKTYEKIFNMLTKIRNNQQTLDTLKTIILRE